MWWWWWWGLELYGRNTRGDSHTESYPASFSLVIIYCSASSYALSVFSTHTLAFSDSTQVCSSLDLQHTRSFLKCISTPVSVCDRFLPVVPHKLQHIHVQEQNQDQDQDWDYLQQSTCCILTHSRKLDGWLSASGSPSGAWCLFVDFNSPACMKTWPSLFTTKAIRGELEFIISL